MTIHAEGSYLREAQLQLGEVLSGYDPAVGDRDERLRFESNLRIAAVAGQIAQVEALERIATTLDEALTELRSLFRNGGLS